MDNLDLDSAFILNLASLFVLVVAAYSALRQLRHMQLTRDVEFMHDFDEDLVSAEHNANRKMIYTSVPHPRLEKQAHQKWLETVTSSPEYKQIETELYAFDRMGLFVRKANMDMELGLDLWFDVLARFSILLQYFVANEVENRGGGFMINFCWLVKSNLEYIKKKYRGIQPPIKLIRGPGRPSIEVTIDDISAAIATIDAAFKKQEVNT